jgi:Reverse transcriptase (RNA-dependent DNA polymerase)
MHNGTRQGSILSPYLFSVYIRNVSKTVVNSGIGCHIGNMPCNILLYADDIVILAPSWDAQQKFINLCCNEICNISMCLNVAKSITVIFSPYKSNRRVLGSFPEFNLGCHSIANVNSCKYLGYWLSTDDDDNIDIENHIRLLYARTNFLIRRFSKCSIAVKKCLFKAYCINFYGVALWKRYGVSVMQKFQAAYNKCIKLFFFVMSGGIASQQCSWN